MKAFLGMGLLGSGFVRAMLQKANWYRFGTVLLQGQTIGSIRCKRFDDAAEAVQVAADFIHLTLRMMPQSMTFWKLLPAGFKHNVIIIDHTTTSAKGAIQRTSYWKSKGVIYLHAPVLWAPEFWRVTGFMLVSGDQSVICTVESALSKMTGKLLNFWSGKEGCRRLKTIGKFVLPMPHCRVDALRLAKFKVLKPKNCFYLLNNWIHCNCSGKVEKITDEIE